MTLQEVGVAGNPLRSVHDKGRGATKIGSGYGNQTPWAGPACMVWLPPNMRIQMAG